MDLLSYRKSLGISQEECARQLGIRSKGHISEIECGTKDASVRLALKIERWSGGKVTAASVSNEAAEIARMKPAQAAA